MLKVFALLILQALARPPDIKTVPLDQILPTRSILSESLVKSWEQMGQKDPGAIDKQPLSVIKTRRGYVLIQGHHQAAGLLELGRPTATVNVLKDYSDRPYQKARQKIIEGGYAIEVLPSWKSVKYGDDLSPNVPETAEGFLKLLRERRKKIKFDPADYRDKLGQVLDINVNNLCPGQVGFAYLIAKEIIQNKIDSGEVAWNSQEDEWILPYDNGRSALSRERLPVGILTNDCILLIDGHHKILSSMFFGSTRVPVELSKQDFTEESIRSSEEFFKTLEDKGLVFLLHLDETKGVRTPRHLDEMENDDNRYLATLIIGRLKVNNKKKGGSKIQARRGPAEAIALKLNRDIPFFEVKIGWELRKHGIVYDAAWGSSVPANKLEEIRQILLNAQHEQGLMMNSMVLLNRDQKFYELPDSELARIIAKHLESCRDLLIDPSNYF